MKTRLAAVLVSLGLVCSAWAQVDADNPPTPPPGSQQPAPVNDRSVSLKEIIPNVVDDQKQIWTFPARLTHDHYWIIGFRRWWSSL